MRKITWGRRVLIAGLLGVLTTFVLAWILTIPMRTRFYIKATHIGWYVDEQGKRVEFHFESIGNWESTPAGRMILGTLEQRNAMLAAIRRKSPPAEFVKYERQESMYGFPVHAMSYVGVDIESPKTNPFDGKIFTEFRLENCVQVHRKTAHAWGYPWGPPSGYLRFPTRILFPGFLIDIAFWGVAAFTLLFGPGITRRYLRSKRNLCLHCGYNLTGNTSGVCSECGDRIEYNR